MTKRGQPPAAVVTEEERAASQAARAAWAKLIYRVYEVDPLICVRCGNEMRVIAVINDGSVIQQILQHLKLWNPRPTERSPPHEGTPDWPVNAQLPVEYVAVPDIGRSCASLRPRHLCVLPIA